MLYAEQSASELMLRQSAEVTRVKEDVITGSTDCGSSAESMVPAVQGFQQHSFVYRSDLNESAPHTLSARYNHVIRNYAPYYLSYFKSTVL